MVGRDMTIGQYMARDTLLHRVDPRLKVALAVTASVCVFLYSGGWDILVFSALLLTVLAISRLPVITVLRSLRTVWVIVLLTAVMQLFLTPGETVARLGFMRITDTGLFNAVLFSSRIILLVIILGALTMTTAPVRLADAMESLLGPFRKLGVPVSRITTVVSITLMFIPNILEQSRKVVTAQMARGADFESWHLLRRVKDVIPVLVPLFIRVFNDSEELATSMEARAYNGGEGRTRLYPLKLGAAETLASVAFAGMTVAIVFLL